MSELSNTPEPPYYAVIFTSRRASEHEGYGEMADRMEEIAREHREAQRLGRADWYNEYAIRVARVERGRSFVRVLGCDSEVVEGV